MASMQSAKRGTIRPYVLSVLSGFLLVFSFPPFELHFVAWVALVPLLCAVDGERAGSSLIYGLVTGITFFGGALPWMYHAMHNYGHINPLLCIALLFILVLYLALYFSLFAWLSARFVDGVGLIAFAPALFVALEYARGCLLTGFPWALLGHSQYRLPSMIQVASITGVEGVSFLIVLVNALLWYAVMNWKKDKRSLAAPLFGSLLVAANVLWGNWQLGTLEKQGGTPFRAALVQGNIEQELKWDPVYRDMVTNRYLDLTAQAAKYSPQLIVWPEAAAPFYYRLEQHYTEMTRRVVKSMRIPLLFGGLGQDDEGGNGGRFYNRAYIVHPSGEEMKYDKIHLVPFGEYVPFRRLLSFTQKLTDALAGDTEPGKNIVPVKVDGITAGIQICYEIIFADGTRAFVQNGARMIVNLTNDAWYGRSAASSQHMMSLPFRAVENRVPILRAANTGISCFVTAAGEIRNATPLFMTMVAADTVIIPPPGETFYTKYGELFSFASIFAAVAAFFLFTDKRRRR